MIGEYVTKKRRINLILTIALVLSGVSFAAVGSVKMLGAVDSAPAKKDLLAVLKSRCESSLIDARLIPQRLPNERIVRVTSNELESPEHRMGELSVAIQQCVGFEVDEMCIGPGCSSKVEITLKALEQI